MALLPLTLKGLAFHIGVLEAYLKRLSASRPFTLTSEQFESRRGVSHRLLKKGNSRFKLHLLAPLQLQNRRIILALLRFADGLMLTTDTVLEQKRLIQTEEKQRGRSAAQSKSKVS